MGGVVGLVGRMEWMGHGFARGGIYRRLKVRVLSVVGYKGGCMGGGVRCGEPYRRVFCLDYI